MNANMRTRINVWSVINKLGISGGRWYDGKRFIEKIKIRRL